MINNEMSLTLAKLSSPLKWAFKTKIKTVFLHS
jgi:hypothetical protein